MKQSMGRAMRMGAKGCLLYTSAPDAGQVVRRLVCGGHHSVEYRAHFVRVFLQREDSQHGNVTKYIDRVNPRICPVFAFFGRKMGASIL